MPCLLPGRGRERSWQLSVRLEEGEVPLEVGRVPLPAWKSASDSGGVEAGPAQCIRDACGTDIRPRQQRLRMRSRVAHIQVLSGYEVRRLAQTTCSTWQNLPREQPVLSWGQQTPDTIHKVGESYRPKARLTVAQPQR